MLDEQYKYLLDNLIELTIKYKDKTIAIVGNKVVAIYDDPKVAYIEIIKNMSWELFCSKLWMGPLMNL